MVSLYAFPSIDRWRVRHAAAWRAVKSVGTQPDRRRPERGHLRGVSGEIAHRDVQNRREHQRLPRRWRFGSYLGDGWLDGGSSVDPGRTADSVCRRGLFAGLNRGARRARRVRREAAVGAAAVGDLRGDGFVIAARCSSSDRVCGGRVHFADRERSTRASCVGISSSDCRLSRVDLDAARSSATCCIRRRHYRVSSSERPGLASRFSSRLSGVAAAVFRFAFESSCRRRSGARRVSVHLHPGAAFRALSSAVSRVRLVSDRRLLRGPGEPQVMIKRSRRFVGGL